MDAALALSPSFVDTLLIRSSERASAAIHSRVGLEGVYRREALVERAVFFFRHERFTGEAGD